MANWNADVYLDASLNYLVDEADKLVVLDGFEATPTYSQCTTAADAGTNHMLAISEVFDISATEPVDGDVSGRKITIPETAIAAVGTGGTATHVGLVDSVGSVLLYIAEITSQVLTAPNPVTVPAWDIELRDPT
jgi:hypothetical protein